MNKCFFNNNYDNEYNCTYEIDDTGISGYIEYYDDELQLPICGLKNFGFYKIPNKDILIVDELKNIYYFISSDTSSLFYEPLFGYVHFESYTYISSNCFDELIKSDKMFKAIRLDLNIKGNWQIEHEVENNNINIHLNTEKQKQKISEDNINKIQISNSYKRKLSENTFELKETFIELEFTKCIKLNEINEYINELLLYLKLYTTNKININKIEIYSNYWCELHTNIKRFHKLSNKAYTNGNLIDFLKKCYKKIKYRYNKEIYNTLEYLLFEYTTQLEDYFLMCRRFIEVYYGKTNKKLKEDFNKLSDKKANSPKKYDELVNDFEKLKDKYDYITNLNISNVNYVLDEIYNLRHHYTHEGYYITPKDLYERNKLDYLKNDSTFIAENGNIKIDWIKNRINVQLTIISYIIFNKILKIENFKIDYFFIIDY